MDLLLFISLACTFSFVSGEIDGRPRAVDIDAECRGTALTCYKAARTEKQKAQCEEQAAICQKTKTAKCAKKCILPLLRCRLHGMGNWKVQMRCFKTFIHCAGGGCLPTNNGVVDETDVLQDWKPRAVDIDAECRGTALTCYKAAKSEKQKAQCEEQAAICQKTKTAKCAKKCILPLLRCRLHGMGNWKVQMRCFKTFIHCAGGGCLPTNKVGGGVEVVPPPPKCDDKYGYCHAWSKRGWCHGQYMRFMVTHCCKSCSDMDHKKTTPAPTKPPTKAPICVDDDPNCPSWADAGECENNPDWMLVHCKKSCHVC